MSRGSAVIEVLVVGTLAVALVLATAVSSVRIQTAGERVDQAARLGADWGARWGDAAEAEAVARRHAPGSTATAARIGDRLRVTVRFRVPVAGPSGSPLSVTVVGRAESTIAPYRSRR